MNIIDFIVISIVILLILEQMVLYLLIRRLENEQFNIFIHNEHED